MAYVVQSKPARFEVRESRSTPKGPRSRTLASFAEMDDDVIKTALERAAKPLTAETLRRLALRAGAPVAGPAVDRAGHEILRRLARGDRLHPKLRRLMLDALTQGHGSEQVPKDLSDSARAATEWIGATPDERGSALRDLLELTDALPIRPRSPEIGFPRLRSV
jgi:hypothetical protein